MYWLKVTYRCSGEQKKTLLHRLNTSGFFSRLDMENVYFSDFSFSLFNSHFLQCVCHSSTYSTSYCCLSLNWSLSSRLLCSHVSNFVPWMVSTFRGAWAPTPTLKRSQVSYLWRPCYSKAIPSPLEICHLNLCKLIMVNLSIFLDQNRSKKQLWMLHPIAD